MTDSTALITLERIDPDTLRVTLTPAGRALPDYADTMFDELLPDEWTDLMCGEVPKGLNYPVLTLWSELERDESGDYEILTHGDLWHWPEDVCAHCALNERGSIDFVRYVK